MTQKMSRDEAVTFDGASVAHIAMLNHAAAMRRCKCAPYVDWFTYGRWAAQGQQVQKGEHGVVLTTFVPIVEKADDGSEKVIGKRPWAVHVFCRCQVKEARRE